MKANNYYFSDDNGSALLDGVLCHLAGILKTKSYLIS